MDPIDLSNYAGLAAIALLTLNILLGMVLAIKYNPVREWPHRRVNTVKIHNLIGYAALAVSLVHPALLLLPSRVPFSLLDVLVPVDAPKQPLVNTLGAAALYLLAFVVVTSYFRREIGRRWWKRMHLATYALFPFYALHSILTDPTLRDHPIDPIDGEKVFVELCVLLVVIAVGARVRWQMRRPPPRQHRAKRAGEQKRASAAA